MNILKYGLSLIVLTILLISLRRGKLESELTEEEKKQIKKNGGYRDIVRTKIAIALVLIGYIFISDTFKIDDDKKTESMPRFVKTINNKSSIVDLKYEISKYYTGDMPAFNLQINGELCEALKYAILKEGAFKVNVKGFFQDGSFVKKDSYGNSESVKDVVAFEATWWSSDIQKYNCDNYPDIWKHGTIDNLSIEFTKMIRQEFLKNNIKVILTTHSPSTVAEIESNELYEMINESNSHKIVPAKNESGKRKILEKLAPKFVYDDELGLLALKKCKQNVIIFTEGSSDNTTLRDYVIQENKQDSYTFIQAGGAENIECLVKAFSVIPYFQKILTYKKIFFIFDFEKADGVLIQFGGQIALNVAHKLQNLGLKILGTSLDSIDISEDRQKFNDFLNKLNIKEPKSLQCRVFEIDKKVDQIIFPVIIRPSYVIGGSKMRVCYNVNEFNTYLLNHNQNEEICFTCLSL
ncbi:MAG: hypothetical protein RL208_191 [Pseudomonadota bacterium]|jgi:hypothetical protein